MPDRYFFRSSSFSLGFLFVTSLVLTKRAHGPRHVTINVTHSTFFTLYHLPQQLNLITLLQCYIKLCTETYLQSITDVRFFLVSWRGLTRLLSSNKILKIQVYFFNQNRPFHYILAVKCRKCLIHELRE